MKQKVLIKVSMNNHASGFFCFSPQSPHTKAMRLAGGFPGVQSVALVGDRDQIEVKGEVDAVNLANSLRKKFGSADIMSVDEVKKEESEKKPEEDVKPIPWPYPRHEIVYVHPEPWW